jgi:hypothetical protein
VSLSARPCRTTIRGSKGHQVTGTEVWFPIKLVRRGLVLGSPDNARLIRYQTSSYKYPPIRIGAVSGSTPDPHRESMAAII